MHICLFLFSKVSELNAILWCALKNTEEPNETSKSFYSLKNHIQPFTVKKGSLKRREMNIIIYIMINNLSAAFSSDFKSKTEQNYYNSS